MPFYLTLPADAEGKANELDQGLGHLAEAERLMAETEGRWAEAELYRVQVFDVWLICRNMSCWQQGACKASRSCSLARLEGSFLQELSWPARMRSTLSPAELPQ
jgi:hypothetical protein